MVDKNVSKFIKDYYSDGMFYSHVSMISPRGKYMFNRVEMETFWDIYCDAVKEGTQKIGIAEKPQNYIPILIDIDIKVEKDDDEIYEGHLYTEEQVIQLIRVYQSVLRNIVDNCREDDLRCCLLEKPIYEKKRGEAVYISSGIHLQFYNIFLSKKDQEEHLIPRVIDAINEQGFLGNLSNDGKGGSLVDKASCTVPWLLYGSVKDETKEPYKLTAIYDVNCEKISMEEAFSTFQMWDNRDRLVKFEGSIEKYLPRILSINPYNRITNELRPNLGSPIKEKEIRENKKNNRATKVSTIDALEICKKIMPMLSDARARDRNEWMSVGWALYSISDGTVEGLDLWLEFSSRDRESFDEEVCEREWGKMAAGNMTLGTLKFFAKTDNPEMFREYIRKECEKHVESALMGSHTDIARILHNEYATEFVCSSVANKTWYQFIDHIWEEIEEGKFLRDRISDQVVEMYKKVAAKIAQEQTIAPDTADKSSQSKLARVQKLIANLKTSNFKNCVMKESADLFYNKHFKSRLDLNPYLIAFQNGVYDLRTNQFRGGLPEDYLSKKMPINYVNYSATNDKVIQVYEFLEKVFPDKSIRRYFMDQASDLFMGGNHQKTVLFWLGSGDNGKSVTQLFFDKMMGEYAIKISTTLITGKKSSVGSASPELARAGGGVRLVTLEEPSADEEINIGYLKSLSGNDSYWARDLFEKGKSTREIIPLFKLYFICLAGHSKVSLTSGISVSLEKLINNKQKLLSWDIETNGLLNTSQHKFLDKGEQECVTLTLLDGREITCTPNHKFLTDNNEWIEAQNIKIGYTNLKMGIDNPNCDDIFENYNYILNFGEYRFDLNIYTDRLKAMAYVRLLGYMLTDGTRNYCLYIGHKIDCEVILEDVELLTGKRPNYFINNNIYQMNLGSKLCKSFTMITPVQLGGRVNNEATLPEFIFDVNCPKFIIREFIGAMFGGDGILPSHDRNIFTALQFVGTKIDNHKESLVNMYERLSTLLLERFEVESYVSNFKYASGENKNYVFLNIGKQNSIIKFCENIGIRYCCHKSYRMMAIASYYRYKKLIIKKNIMIINRTRELYDKYNRQNPTPLILQISKENGEILNTYRSTQEVENIIGIHHSNIRDAIRRKGCSGGFVWKEQELSRDILDEPGCETLNKAHTHAVNEINTKVGHINDKYIITYTQATNYIRNNSEYKMPSISIKEYLDETNLFQFCNQGLKNRKYHHYSVSADRTTLPCYNMRVISIKNVGMKHVYDINIDEPYSNFLVEGTVTHNCNKLPRIKNADKAVWNRIRVISFESTFVRQGDECPSEYAEQLRQKRFPMDTTFSSKIPDLVEAFAWILLEHRKNIKERFEPEKVRLATSLYKKQNDFYRQYMEECIIEDNMYSLSLLEIYESFKTWYKGEGYMNAIPVKNEVKEYFTTLWGDSSVGTKWKGYRIRTLKDSVDDGEAIILDDDDLVDYSCKPLL